MTDYIGVAPDGPGRCEHCLEVGHDQGLCTLHAARRDVLAALDEQVSEALGHMNEPSYSTHDCRENAKWFGVVRDWLADNWDEVTA